MAFSISGSTQTAVGGAISGVTVTAFNYPGGTSAGSAVSDGSGNYTISNLTAGDYTLTATLVGWSLYNKLKVSNVAALQPMGVAIINANVTGMIFTAFHNATIVVGSAQTNGTSGSSVASFVLAPAMTVFASGYAIAIIRNGSGGQTGTISSSLGNTYTLNYSFTDSAGAVNSVFISNVTTGGSETLTANFSPNVSFATAAAWPILNNVGFIPLLNGVFSGGLGVVATDSTTVASGTSIDSATLNSQVPIAFLFSTCTGGVAATTGRGLLLSTLDSTNLNYGRNWGHATLLGVTSGTCGMNFGSSFTNAILNSFIVGIITNGIRGNCGVGGATVSYSGPRSGSVTADLAGNYYIPFTSLADVATWTITPSLAGITFTPTNNTVAVSALNANVAGPSFTGSTTITVGPTYTATDTTITATWTTAGACDSNIFAGAKAGLDNGLPCSESSHFAIVTGLTPGTTYSMTVQSLSTVSSPSSVTTNAAPSRILLSGTTSIGTSVAAAGSTGDTAFTFKSNDGNEYITWCDGGGFAGGNVGNVGVDKISTLSPFAGTNVNNLTGFGAFNTYDGQDAPDTVGSGSTKKWGGTLFGIKGNLYGFPIRQSAANFYWYRGELIMSPDHGATWGNAQIGPGVFSAAGAENNPPICFQYDNNGIGWASPIRYAADDGTLGYNTAGNQIDGGNGWVYQCAFGFGGYSTYGPILIRSRRRAYVQLMSLWQGATPYTISYQYWIGPLSPTTSQFVNDANWSSSPASATNIFGGFQAAGSFVQWPHITFVATLNSYISTWNTNNFVVAGAPTPAGPWTVIYNGAMPSGLTDLRGPAPLHSDAIGNVATQNVSLRLVHTAAPGANYQLRITSGTTFTTTPYVPPTPSGGAGTQGDMLNVTRWCTRLWG